MDAGVKKCRRKEMRKGGRKGKIAECEMEEVNDRRMEDRGKLKTKHSGQKLTEGCEGEREEK